MDGEPYEVLESQFLRMQQRKPVVQAKIKNLATGKITQRSFHQNESFKEAEIDREPMKFLFSHRNEFTFIYPSDPSKRVSLNSELAGEIARYLKPNLEVIFKKFGETLLGIEIPIKIDYVVKSAPPADKGNTAQGGSKEIELENGLRIQAPLFINEGDIVRVNTQTGEYAERAEKTGK
ncbi:MAG: elongation factor P [Candidatus Niyogibacteria bacterium]|nr:MAG: elongation factor P [Candidatus Niyogibacteria bacterium]